MCATFRSCTLRSPAVIPNLRMSKKKPGLRSRDAASKSKETWKKKQESAPERLQSKQKAGNEKQSFLLYKDKERTGQYRIKGSFLTRDMSGSCTCLYYMNKYC